MENADRQIIWVIHYRYYDGDAPGIVDRAYTSEEEARWQIKLLIDLSDGSGRTYTLHSLPVY
jgi:hypothetical protein